MEERNDDNKNYSTPDKASLSSQKDSAKSSSSQQDSPANNRKLPYQRSPSSPSPISFDLSSISNKSQYATLIAKAKQTDKVAATFSLAIKPVIDAAANFQRYSTAIMPKTGANK